jgi:hypothetical protein
MALNFPSSPTTGQTYTDDNGVIWEYDSTKWNVVTGTSKKLFSGAKVRLTATATLNSTPSVLDFDVEDFDVGDYYDFTQASRYTISQTGYYRVAGTFYTGTNGSGESYTYTLKKNGSVTLTTQTSSANQAASYDSSILLNAGDYLQIEVSESSSTGTLLSGSYFEIQRLGYSSGSGINAADIFSGVRTIVNSNITLSSTATAISWTSTEFNENADAFGNLYWSIAQPSRITIKVSGYYQIKSFMTTSSDGAANSYTISLKKNNTTNIVSSVLLGPNDNANIDELFFFNVNDYIELFASNSGSVGSILSPVYLELIRVGV